MFLNVNEKIETVSQFTKLSLFPGPLFIDFLFKICKLIK